MWEETLSPGQSNRPSIQVNEQLNALDYPGICTRSSIMREYERGTNQGSIARFCPRIVSSLHTAIAHTHAPWVVYSMPPTGTLFSVVARWSRSLYSASARVSNKLFPTATVTGCNSSTRAMCTFRFARRHKIETEKKQLLVLAHGSFLFLHPAIAHTHAPWIVYSMPPTATLLYVVAC